MVKTANGVTFKGKPLTLIGELPAVGQPAPDAELVKTDMSTARLRDYRGYKLVITSVPSLDTSVCDMETRRFDEVAGNLGQDVKILVVSVDLPFAQSRWCGAAGVSHVETLSDHRDAAFGKAYGVLIQELRLLARAVFLVDAQGRLRYRQLVDDISHEPDYDEVLEAIKGL